MATTTTNNGWTIPQSTDLVTNGATAIATLGNGIDTSVGTGLKAWTAYTPTTTNITLGTGGTVAGYYSLLGKTMQIRILVTLGTGGQFTGQPTFSTPATVGTARFADNVLNGQFLDAGVSYYPATVVMSTTTSIGVSSVDASGTYAKQGAVSTTAPFTSGSGDKLIINGTYEVA